MDQYNTCRSRSVWTITQFFKMILIPYMNTVDLKSNNEDMIKEQRFHENMTFNTWELQPYSKAQQCLFEL